MSLGLRGEMGMVILGLSNGVLGGGPGSCRMRGPSSLLYRGAVMSRDGRRLAWREKRSDVDDPGNL